jgi:hypothetical protein
LKRFLTAVLFGGLLFATAGPALASTPTEKATNVQISAAGLARGELRVSWTIAPESSSAVFTSYLAILKDSNGAEVKRSLPLSERPVSYSDFGGLVNGQTYSAEVITNYDGASLVTMGTGTATPYSAPEAPAKPQEGTN